MPLRLAHIICCLAVICISYNANAQTLGGSSSNGGDTKVTPPYVCSAPENVSIYFGGNANGSSVQILKRSSCAVPENTDIYKGGISGKATNVLTNCVAPDNPVVLYKGGNANGASSSNIVNCPVAITPNFFTGGISDGYSISTLTQSACSSPENSNVLFFGGVADGYFNSSFTQSVCTPPENLNIFRGGNAEGFCNQSLTQQTCGSPENSNIFFGGDADGYGAITLTQCVGSTPENISIFIGGNSDGFAQTSLPQTSCSVPENLDIFLGGNADGFAMQSKQQTVCPSAENFNIFLGGNADGFASYSFTQSVCALPENVDIFMGGISDGFAKTSLSQSSCSPSVNSNIFFGGNADGFATSVLTNCTPPESVTIYFGGNANGAGFANIINCPSGLYSVNIYTGGDANGASAQILQQKTCSPPENISIYFGGNANGASIQKLQQKLCSAAENINIYFGGNANGASVQVLRQKTCPSPDNLNIYFGGNANGASVQILQQKTCPSPDNLNIYFGGNANGADNKRVINKTCPSPENWNIFFGGIADGYATTILTQSYYWTGAIDHNWHNPGNWSTNIVPDIYAPVIIPKVVNYPIVSQGVAFAKSVIVQLNMRLDIVNKNFTSAYNFNSDGDINISGIPVLSVGGDLKCNGTFTSGNSKVLLNAANGTQSVSINTGDFYDVEVNTAATAKAQLSSTLAVRHNLSITTGILDASSNSLSVGGNWLNTGSFNPGTGTVTFNGTYQTLTNANGEQFNNLEVANNTNLVLNNNAIVANTLKFTSGTVTSGINKLIIGSGISSPGNLQYTSGRVIGYLERWITGTGNYLFPVGTSSNLESATLNINSGIVSGSVICSFVSGNPGNGGLPLTESGVTISKQYPEGYWSFSAANSFAVADYNVALSANGFSTYYFNSDVRVIKRTNNGGWTLDGTHANASFPNVYRNNLIGGISVSGTQFGLGVMDCIGGTIGDNEIICYNDDVTPFSSIIPAKGGDGNFTYTWQYSTNTAAIAGDSNWTDLPASNTPAFDYGNLQSTTLFVRKAVNIGCPSALFSNILLIKVGLKPVPGPVYKKPNF